MKKLAIFFVTLQAIILISCTQENLDGHWHISAQEPAFETTFDISDTILIVGKYSLAEKPMTGKINTTVNEIKIPILSSAQYKIKGNELHLFGFGYNDDGEKFIGIKQDSTSCSLYSHVFDNCLVKINLPYTDNYTDLIKMPKNHISNNIFIGIPKNKNFGNETSINIHDSFAKKEDLTNWVIELSRNYNNKKTHVFTIYASKETDVLFIKNVVKALNSVESTIAYQAFRIKNENFGKNPYKLKLLKHP